MIDGGSVMKRYVIFLFVLIIVLCSCTAPAHHYELQKSFEDIAKVDIFDNAVHSNNIADLVWIKTIEKSEYTELLGQIIQLDCYIPFNDPPDYFGDYVLRITYLDGSYELIGSTNSIYFPHNGKTKFYYYRFPDNFNVLVSQYLDS